MKLTKKQSTKVAIKKSNPIAAKKNNNCAMYTITEEPINNLLYSDAPGKMMQKLHLMAFKNPKKAITQCLEAMHKYPQNPVLYNYLTIAYKNNDDTALFEKTVLEAYEKFPTYLFAKCAYTNLKLDDGIADEIPIVFEYKLSLPDLYPSRNTFHTSEVFAFNFVMARYFAQIGQMTMAYHFFEELEEIDSDDEAIEGLRNYLFLINVKNLFTSIITIDKQKKRKGKKLSGTHNR